MAESPTDEAASTSPPSSAPLPSNPFENLPPLEELIGRPDPPPLRIHHIMAAMAAVAVMLSITYTLRQSDSFGLSTFAGSSGGIVMAMTTALAVTLVGFGFVWRQHGYAFFDLPGHWLLLGQSLMIGFFALMAVIEILELPEDHVATNVLIGVFFVSQNVVGIGLNLWAARRIADSISWTLIFLIDGLTVVSVYGLAWFEFHEFMHIVLWGAPAATLVLLLLAAWRDRRDHVRRDWPHWFGVCLRIVSTLQIVGRPIWAWAAGLLTI